MSDPVKDIFASARDHPKLDELEQHKAKIRGEPKKDLKKPPAAGPPKKFQGEEYMTFLASTFSMFKYASGRDKCMLFIGTIFTFIHGASFPVLALLFGSISETFIIQSYEANHNSSGTFLSRPDVIDPTKPNVTGDDIMSKLIGQNTTGSQKVTTEAIFGFIGSKIGAFGPQKPLSREEFLDYTDELSIIAVGIGLVVFVSSFIQTVCFELAADNQAYKIRQHFLFQVLRQEIPWFETRTAGNLIVKLADDVERFREGIGHKFSIIIEYAACFGVGAFFGLATNWKLGLIFGTSVPFIFAKLMVLARELAQKATEQQEEYGEAGATSAEIIPSVRTVAAFGAEDDEKKRYENETIEGHDKAVSNFFLMGISSGFLFTIIYGSYALGFWYACGQLMDNAISPRQVYTVFFCVSIGVLALANSISFISTIACAYGSSRVISSTIATNPKIDPYSEEGRQPQNVGGKIKFTDVSFHYPSRDDVLVIRDLSLEIKSGHSVAIVGESGSGKSTIVNLLMRFYDPQSGHIMLDDADLKHLNVTWLRQQIGIVAQNPVFDESSIFDNIAGSKINVIAADVENAAKMACAHEFIEKLPEKYDTKIGMTGRKLSPGQKQRIAVARALMTNPAVLILDEATSGLDVATATKLYNNIKKMRSDRTTISISHRLSHIQRVDMIYVLKGGEIVESGGHKELVETNGLYCKMLQDEHMLQTLEVQPDDAVVEADSVNTAETRKKSINFSTENLLEESIDIDVDLAAFEYDASLKFPTFSNLIGIINDEKLWNYIFWGMTGSIISGLIIPLFALVFSQLFVTFSETGDELFSDAMFWTEAVLVIALASGIGMCLRIIFVSTCGECLTWRLRVVTFVSILRQATGWFDDETNSPTRLFTRLASDAPFIKVAIGTRLGTAISAIVSLTAALIIAFILEWQLAVVVACSIPILFLLVLIQSHIYENHQMTIGRQMESAIRLATKSVQNIWSVQALNLEHHILRRFQALVDPALTETHKQSIKYSLIFALTETIVFITFAAVFRLGAHLIYTENLDAILLFKVFIVLAFCSFTTSHFTSFTPDYVKAKIAMAHIYLLYDMDSTIDSYDDSGALPEFAETLVFKDVHFSYPSRPNVEILKGISFKFDLKLGTSLGIIGATGSGKSTILSLMERFYDISKGQMIDGNDIRQINVSFLRQCMGLVAQEPILFDKTIGENISYGFYPFDDDKDTDVKKLTDKEKAALEAKKEVQAKQIEELVIKVADSIGLTQFLGRLPEGLKTKVGVRGCRLTGGQRQKIAIARALIRDPRILLLDEPTSALDPEDEVMVLKTLEKARQGRISIIASNRPSCIRNVDVVAVLVNGKLEEFGTPDELNEKKGFYYEFVKASQPEIEAV